MDISIDHHPTENGTYFTYRIPEPQLNGRIYWVLTKASTTLTTFDEVCCEYKYILDNNGQCCIPNGCSGNAKQVDTEIHTVHLHCRLQPGQTYKVKHYWTLQHPHISTC